MSCSTCPAKALLDKSQESHQNNTDTDCGKLGTHDWLEGVPMNESISNLVEVRFKNTRKGFFLNSSNLTVKRGDYVAVEADRGHDIGQITLMGKLADLQLTRKNPRDRPSKKIYRRANVTDIEKWNISRLKEKPFLIKARQMASSLKLEMKISDIEFQGDGSRAVFYYIADGRVDFRELIKMYAKAFNTRIEMRQIGARQEAALVGGIGSCGKELCCSSWRVNLDTVITNAARIQQLPHNAQKLTGQCGKLKCCLMYELDTYIDAEKDFPDILLELETDAGIAYPKKKDLLQKTIYYAVGSENSAKHIPVHLDRVKEIIQLNKKGIKVDKLNEETAEDLAKDTELKFISHQQKDLSAPIQQPKTTTQNNRKRKFKKKVKKVIK